MKTVLITGANRGIGLEFARRYLSDGWRVIALNRGDCAPDALSDVDGHFELHRGDLALDEDVRRMAAELRGTQLDLLIHNAGIMGTQRDRTPGEPRQGLQDFDRDEWRDVLDVNVVAGAQLLSLLRSNLAPGARVVFLSSSMASIAGNDYGGWAAYRASKAAVNSVVKTFALELGSAAVIAALHPGWVKTDMGGPEADLEVGASVRGMMRVIRSLGPEHSGAFLGYDGTEEAY